MTKKTNRLFLTPFSCPDATDHLLRAALETGIPPERMLYLTPSPRKLRDTQLRFARLMGRQAFIPPLFRTPRQLSRELHLLYGRTRPFPSELKPVLVQRLLAPGPAKPTLGYARVVANFIRDIKNHVPAEQRPQLPEIFSQYLAPYDKPLRSALAALETMERYDAELANRGWSDEEDILSQSSSHLARWHNPPQLLLLDSFVAPNQPEKELLKALLQLCPQTMATAYQTDNSCSESRLADSFKNFLLSCAPFDLAPLPEPESAPWQSARLYGFADIESEVRGICRAIRNQMSRNDLSETVVVFPRLTSYVTVVERLFQEYGIPCTIYPSAPLASSPPVQAALELLRAQENDYERIALAAALSSPFLCRLLAYDDQEELSTIGRFAASVNHYSRQAGIIKGQENWRNIATRLQASAEGELDEQELEFLKELQSRIRLALSRIDRLTKAGPNLGNQALALKELLGQVRFCQELEPLDRENAPDLMIQRSAELLLDRRALYDLLDSLILFEKEFGSGTGQTASLSRTLESLTSLIMSSREPDPAGVLVIDMAETLGLAPAQLYFGGLTEPNLPGAYEPDPILPDSVRKALGMPDMEWHRDWQRFHFRRTLESARSVPFLSFHETRDGNPVLPTPFLELEPVHYQDQGTIFSPVEEQLWEGENHGKRFEEHILTVDFQDDHPVLAVLQSRFGPDHALSVTRLEAYRRCPFRFYLENVLGIDSPPEPSYEIDARLWGQIVHRTLARLYSRGDIPPESLSQTAQECFRNTLTETDLPRFWVEVMARVFSNLLPEFIKKEQQLRAEGYKPVKTELSISGNITPDIKIKGRLDRIDSGNGALRIIDYKTGSTQGLNTKAILVDRTHIQLPLYAKLLSEQEQLPISNLGIYSLRDLMVRWLADSEHPVAELVSAAIENTCEIVAAIRAGRFRAEPARDDTCRRCDLAFTCGRQPAAEGE